MSEQIRGPTADPERALTLLRAQFGEAQTELGLLRGELALIRKDLGTSRASDLREANERLVVAAIAAESSAELAARNLTDLRHASQRDAMTDTPNRAQTLDRLETAILSAQDTDTRVAALFVDVDQFKNVNDTLGHAAGDEVMKLVADRLKSAVRHTDTVSRHGGDEFLVLLAPIAQPADAGVLAAKINATLAAPAQVGSHVLNLSASVGIAVYPEDGHDAATLIDRADTAMYRSKRQGLGSFEFYDDDLQSSGEGGIADAGVAQPPARPVTVAQDDARLPDLLEANERLLMAALDAQETGARAVDAHLRQVKFMAVVAHELRDPLAPIRAATELLGRIGLDDPRLGQVQGIMKRQVSHLARLVDDLLDGSRVSMGKFVLRSAAVDLLGVLNLAIDTCRPAIASRRQTLAVEIPINDPLPMYGDPVRLAQIFINLLENATKYTPDGGAITLSAETRDGGIRVAVADNGIGISAAMLPRIFDLFVQELGARALHTGGLGIGLAVVRELVEAHGGSVTAASDGANCGSEFVVTLPVDADRVMAGGSASERDPLPAENADPHPRAV